MFTGIIEEKGSLRRRTAGSRWGSLEIAAHQVTEGTRVGDSIAVNGACLTVTGLFPGGFAADVMPETMERTNLGNLSPGDEVNLERAMAFGGRFGGHLVSGHIDGAGRLQEQRKEGNALWLTIGGPPPILALMVEKGSVAVDGVSLTVAAVDEAAAVFQVSLIPHTARETTLPAKKPGDLLNLENDMVGKYIQKLLLMEAPRQGKGGGAAGTASGGKAAFGGSGLTLEFLHQNGF
ncbi:MAG: riboflavin synthase [Peptococcaceae bacterium]|nr:riboflavin synthase [Peptococcaceae bacterium]